MTNAAVSQETKPAAAGAGRSNRAVALACTAFFGGMIGMSFAAVPLYQLFCQVTGYGGTTQRVEQYSSVILDRDITVRFDANVSGTLPWKFGPVERDTTIAIGETTQIAYRAENLAGRPSAGRASFNVSPQVAGSYFMKVECFCFLDTELAPGEVMEMPVVFYVDPAIADAPELRNISTITLSYTFYPTDVAEPLAAAPAEPGTTDAATQNIGG